MDQKASPTKVPPHDINAEKSVLGGILIDAGAVSEVAEILLPKHFYFEENRLIYEACLLLFEKSKPIDIITVAAELKEQGSLKRIGDKDYLNDLIDIVPTSAYVRQYAEIVKNCYLKRTLISVASKLVEQSFDETGDVRELLNGAETDIFALSQAFLHRDFVELKDILAESFERLEEFMKSDSKMRGIPTGFSSLDNKLAGLQDSNLIILAARPGVGKTTFALNMALHIAMREKKPIGFFSLEMSKEELVDRLLVGQADIDAWKLKTGKLSDEDYTRLTQAMGELSEAPIFIDDTPGLSILEMRTKARKLTIEKGLKMIVVDYLQLATPGKRMESRVQEVSFISQSLKNIARELRIPVIALSQLSRAIEHRGEKKPQLADLRESGCLVGTTLVTLADTGEQVPIASLVNKSNFAIWSMDDEMKINKKTVSRVFPTGKKQTYTITLRSGRRIEATANHKFRSLLSWKRLDALEVGDMLATPRAISQPLRDNKDYSDDQLVLLAHMIGDGCFVQHQPIHYTSNAKEHISIVQHAAKTSFNIEGRIVQQNSWYHLYLPSPYRLSRKSRHPFMSWISTFGLNFAHSYDKELPNSIFTCSERQIGLFLQHLWSTDGSIHLGKKHVRIYYATSSPKLAQQVQALLLRLGIQSNVRKVRQHKGMKDYRPQYNIDIQGAPNQILFLEKVGAVGTKLTQAQQAMRVLCAHSPNPNIDVMGKEIWSLIASEKDKKKISWRDFAERLQMSYSGSALFKSGVGRQRLSRIAAILESDILWQYANSDIFWDEIVSIEEKGIEDVYDMTVPETHNFVAGDIVVHNSIEQDADVVMFLYGDDDNDELMDQSKRMMKLLIAKHRNGPTGEIELVFRGDRVRFFGVDTIGGI